MKLVLKNSLVALMSVLIVFLSVGINVSKMLCAENGQIYIGKDVPSCKQEQELLCIDENDALLCCSKVQSEVLCCPEMEDESCASETQNIQFDFETTFSNFFSLDFSLFYIYINIKYAFSLKEYFFHKRIFIPKILKTSLAINQSFLL